jgi:hypothetical protein
LALPLPDKPLMFVGQNFDVTFFLARTVSNISGCRTQQMRRAPYGATTITSGDGLAANVRENELKVRAINVRESLKSPPNRIDKAV